MDIEKENPELFQKFLKEIEECAEEHLGDWEMKLLEKRPEILSRLYKLEYRVNRAFKSGKGEKLMQVMKEWREAHNGIRSQARKMFGNDIKCEVAVRRVTLKDGKKI